MWILDLMHANGCCVWSHTYSNFGQLAFDEEVHRVVEALAAQGFLKWQDATPGHTTEEPVPTRKLFRTMGRKGAVQGATADGRLLFKLMLTIDDNSTYRGVAR